MSNEGEGDPLVDLRSFLEEKAKAPAPGRTLSLKQTIAGLRPQLIDLKDKGYTDAALVELLKEKNIVIGAGTLKNYMSQTRDTARDTETASEKKPRRTTAASTGNRNATTPEPKPSSPVTAPVASPPTGAPGEKATLIRNPRKPL